MKPRHLPLLLLAAAAAGSVAVPPVHAQEAMRTALLSQEDSARLVRAARSDQSQFERIRRRRLSEAWGGGSSRCDERVGRFCLTHGLGRSEWMAPPEHEEVVAARLTLVDGLNRVAELLPGDAWIAGQRVRYLIEAGRFGHAIEAARQCSAHVSWCSALAGYAFHYASRGEPADSAFDAALAAMDDDEREDWLDLTQILDHRSVRAYRRMTDGEKAEFERRFWHLADPLLTRPGNELRSEHLSRHVWDRLQDRAQSTDGISWSSDLREILIRYGWPSGYEQVRDWGMSFTQGPPSLISHYGGAPQDLLPPPEALLEEPATGGKWDVEDPRSRTGYNLPMEDSVARWFHPLAHQVAVFRRDGRALVVAGYELMQDSVPAGARVSAGVAMLPTLDLDATPIYTLHDSTGIIDALTVETAAEPSVLSLEVLVPSERRIARMRYGLELAPLEPGLIAVSDLLLIHPDAPLPDSLQAAVEVAKGSSRVAAGQQVGLYFEVYGVDPVRTPELTMSLRVLEPRTGWLRRLAERAGLLRESAPVQLRWREGVGEGEYLPRSIAVQIPEISPGEYTLELMIEAPGREPLTVRREITVGD